MGLFECVVNFLLVSLLADSWLCLHSVLSPFFSNSSDQSPIHNEIFPSAVTKKNFTRKAQGYFWKQ